MLVIQVLPNLVHTGNSQDAKQQPHGRAVINASLQHTAIHVQQVQSHGQFLASCSDRHRKTIKIMALIQGAWMNDDCVFPSLAYLFAGACEGGRMIGDIIASWRLHNNYAAADI
jgi:hypothetical protein